MYTVILFLALIQAFLPEEIVCGLFQQTQLLAPDYPEIHPLYCFQSDFFFSLILSLPYLKFFNQISF